MVRIRESKEERNSNQLKKLEEDFTSQVDKFNLKDLSLDELAGRYESIDQQSQLFKGLILLEARSRFPSNNEFGDWVKSVQTLCLDRQEVRTRYMNFARYFKDKEMTGISLTAAYEISAPANEAIADKIYEFALNKNLPVSEIKKQIQIEKGLSLEIETPPVLTEAVLLLSEDLDTFKRVVLSDIEGLSNQNAIKVLQDCIKQIRAKKNNQKIPASVQDKTFGTSRMTRLSDLPMWTKMGS